MQVINDKFSVGERYRGEVNNIVFTVSRIIAPGPQPMPYGGWWELRTPLIEFTYEENGEQKTARIAFDLARRILLEKLN